MTALSSPIITPDVVDNVFIQLENIIIQPEDNTQMKRKMLSSSPMITPHVEDNLIIQPDYNTKFTRQF
jgi:hypothetical protein